MRSGPEVSSSTESASANERFDFVTRARTVSPGHAAAHEHHVALRAGHAGPAVRERVDLELELVAALGAVHPSFDSMAFRTVLRFAFRRS